MAISFLSSQSIDGLLNVTGKATFEGKVSVGGGDTSTAQMALKGQQSLLSFIRGTAGDAQFFMSSDSSRLYFTHTSAQYSTNGILKLDASDASATFAGDLSLTGGSLSITGDGSNAVTFTETGAGLMTIAAPDDIVLDAEGDITIDANGGDIRLKDAGNTFGFFNSSSDNFYIGAGTQDKDIIFQGNDGGSQINMLTLDSSNGGSATFRDDIDLAGSINMTGSSKVIRLNSGGYIDFDSTNLQFNTQRNPNTGAFNDTNKSHAHIGLQGPDGGSQIVFGTAAANNTVATTRLTINSAGNATFSGAVTVTGDFTRTGRFSIGGDVNVDGATDLMINGASRRISFTSGSGTIKTTTGNSLILQTDSSDGIVIDGSTQTVTFAAQLRTAASAASAPGYSFTSDTNTGMYSNATGYLMFAADGTQGMQMTDTALEMKVPIELDTSLAANKTSGTIIRIGSESSMTFGKCYALASGTWEETDPTDENFSKQLLGIALGTDANVDGMLTTGVFYDASHSFTVGEPLYLSTTTGTLTTTAPNTSGDLIRVVGYAIDANHIYFCPDNTWVILD